MNGYGVDDILVGKYKILECRDNKYYICQNINTDERVFLKRFLYESIFLDEKEQMLNIMKHYDNDHHFPKVYDFYSEGDLHFITYELLGPSLLDLKNFYADSFREEAIIQIVRQVCETLILLESIDLHHADIKLENICILNSYVLIEDKNCFIDDGSPQRKEVYVKLIDFGITTTSVYWDTTIKNTFAYRPPEVLLGSRHGKEIDVWALGCVILRLFFVKNDKLFFNPNVRVFLALIQHMLGLIPLEVIQDATNEDLKLLFVNGILDINLLTEEERSLVLSRQNLFQYLKSHHMMCNFVLSCLNTNFRKRITLEQILNHPFIKST